MAENESESPNPSIIPVKIAEEMRTSYMAYAMSVIVGRALPDARDGLKPVHRRILYAMYETGNTWNRAYKKSARIVGDVIGKYHPHGDQSVYDALVRMAQEFSMRVPLVDGQGNFGSVDGDPPAAMRYTEVRMTRACSELLADIEKETVDFGPNYDGNEHEPLVLPARFPNLLVNGSEGIAVGMATRIPPHNLGEVVRACIHLIDNPQSTAADKMSIVPGPDFPTAGIHYGLDGVRDAYETGRGVVRLRARTHIETDDRTGKDTIVVTELPFQVNKARLLEKIAELVREKEIDGITDLRDESDRTGMRMIIECRRDANSQVILNQLFKRTSLETSFGINMLALVAGQPRTLGLVEVLTHFIDFRRDVVTRRCLFELKKAQERMHILEALRRALDMIDEVIRTIRGSKDPLEARFGLMSLLEIDEVQAQAILQMQLQRLTNLEINKLLEEMAELQKEIDWLRTILSSETELLGVIRGELVEIASAYSEKRRTEILNVSGDLTIEDLIADEDEVVTLSHAGYIKRTLVSEYRTQRRGGRGLKGMETKDEDFVKDLWVTNTHASLLVFTSLGRVYRLKVHELPAGGRTSRGKPIVNLIPVDKDERVEAVLTFRDFEPGKYVITATRKGTVKKTPLVAYRNIHAGGIIGVKIVDGDQLVGVALCEPADRVMLVSRRGQSITFDQGAVRPMGRASQGVRGIRLRSGDEAVSMIVVPRDELLNAGLLTAEEIERRAALDQLAAAAAEGEGEGEEIEGVEADAVDESGDAADDGGEDTHDESVRTILTITENGFGKRTRLGDYPAKNRGGLGVITIKTSERNGLVAGARLMSVTDQLMLITDSGKIIRTEVGGISVLGRNTQGVTIIRLERGERVVGMAGYTLDEDAIAEAAGEEAVEGADAPGADTTDVSGDDDAADAMATPETTED